MQFTVAPERGILDRVRVHVPCLVRAAHHSHVRAHVHRVHHQTAQLVDLCHGSHWLVPDHVDRLLWIAPFSSFDLRVL